jgi:tyrosyl-DNA phosphodiesterase-1
MGSAQYASRPQSIQKYFRTLRETIGFDGSTNERQFQWLVVANFLFDVHYFLEQTLPDVLAFKRVVVFYGEGVDAQGIAYWKGLLEGSGNTVDFVRLIPSDPPRSRTNPLDVKIPCECCTLICQAFIIVATIFFLNCPSSLTDGVHHTKMFLVGYEERKQHNNNQSWKSMIRVVVHTANLVQQDVEWKSQGLYSQDFPLKSNEDDHKPKLKNPYAASKKRGWPFEDDDPQPFEDDLVTYLESYRYSIRQSWSNGGRSQSTDPKEMSLLNLIRQYDFSSAYAVLIPSVPGKHSGSNAKEFGYSKLQRTIKEHVLDHRSHDNKSKPAYQVTSPIICQFSSLGSLSTKYLNEFISAIDIHESSDDQTKNKKSEVSLADKMKIVWPTIEEIRTSIEGYRGESIPMNLCTYHSQNQLT